LTHLPGVRDYLRDQKRLATEADLRMNLLAETGPQNLEQAWVYFKHWVKGRPVGPEVCMTERLDIPGEFGDGSMMPDGMKGWRQGKVEDNEPNEAYSDDPIYGAEFKASGDKMDVEIPDSSSAPIKREATASSRQKLADGVDGLMRALEEENVRMDGNKDKPVRSRYTNHDSKVQAVTESIQKYATNAATADSVIDEETGKLWDKNAAKEEVSMQIDDVIASMETDEAPRQSKSIQVMRRIQRGIVNDEVKLGLVNNQISWLREQQKPVRSKHNEHKRLVGNQWSNFLEPGTDESSEL